MHRICPVLFDMMNRILRSYLAAMGHLTSPATFSSFSWQPPATAARPVAAQKAMSATPPGKQRSDCASCPMRLSCVQAAITWPAGQEAEPEVEGRAGLERGERLCKAELGRQASGLGQPSVDLERQPSNVSERRAGRPRAERAYECPWEVLREP
jgi:hypothetical protein